MSEPDAPDPHGPGDVAKSGSYARIYNNTLYHCGFGDADISSSFKYGFQISGIVGVTYPLACRSHPTHSYNFSLDWPWPLSVSFKNNIVYDYNTGEYAWAGSSTGQVTYENNHNGNPLFVDSDISNALSLTRPSLAIGSNSPCLRAGVALTTAIGSGTNSKNLVVADAMYFQDGSWGSSLSDIQPDWIAVGTVGNASEISSINYDTRVITCATAISWTSGDSVWLYLKTQRASAFYTGPPRILGHSNMRQRRQIQG
ncbi:MAG: hypothetical protein MZV63_15605 [Marinilabiliales bacterium]|nr:hypothetical protein [Marinilabiliales bacterium]